MPMVVVVGSFHCKPGPRAPPDPGALSLRYNQYNTHRSSSASHTFLSCVLPIQIGLIWRLIKQIASKVCIGMYCIWTRLVAGHIILLPGFLRFAVSKVLCAAISGPPGRNLQLWSKVFKCIFHHWLLTYNSLCILSWTNITIVHVLLPDFASEPDLENIGYLKAKTTIWCHDGFCTHL